MITTILSIMETWFAILLSLFIASMIRSLFFFCELIQSKKLPPGPSFLSSQLLLITSTIPEFQSILTKLKFKYGPFITLSIGFHPLIFVASHSLAHQLLVHNAAFFSDRPKLFHFCSIASASYGSTWRLLRRNLASDFLHPSRVRSYSSARKQVLGFLIDSLLQQEDFGVINTVVGHFEHALFSLFLLMCFGDQKLDKHCINDIANVQNSLQSLIGSRGFIVYMMSPKLSKILFRKQWKYFVQLSKDQRRIFTSLIQSRIESVGDKRIMAYIDTLVKLGLPENDATNGNGRKLTLKEMVSMCSEFLNVGTGTTINALHWIMANLVKHPHIQSKLYDEIVAVAGPPPPPPGVEPESVISEDDLQKMAYLKAVVLEGLRRHPPAHMVLPHRVTKEVEVEGYMIPQGATINFMMAEMGWDPKVWDEPMEFKPERFMVNDGVFDISGRKEIKMMPFGAGRRICPGYDLALLHLKYFVANLIWYFDWTPAANDGYGVDLSEKVEFTINMKNPLQARISSRIKRTTT